MSINKYFGCKEEDIILAANLISISGEGKFSYQPVFGNIVKENDNYVFYTIDSDGKHIQSLFSYDKNFPITEYNNALNGKGYYEFILYNCLNFFQVSLHLGESKNELQESIDSTTINMLYQAYNIKCKDDLIKVLNIAREIEENLVDYTI